MSEFSQPTPEEAHALVMHTVSIEFADPAVFKAQVEHSDEMKQLIVEPEGRGLWAAVLTDHRHETDRTVSTFTFISLPVDQTMSPVVSIERIGLHMFNWLEEHGVYHVDAIYAGVRTSYLNTHPQDSSFTDYTLETNEFFRQALRLRDALPPDFL